MTSPSEMRPAPPAGTTPAANGSEPANGSETANGAPTCATTPLAAPDSAQPQALSPAGQPVGRVLGGSPSPELARTHIRSFATRQGTLTTGQRQAWEAGMPVWGLAYRPEPVDLAQAFGRDAPRVLEIGFGMGASLADVAAREPQHDFVGVEVYTAGCGSLLRLVAEQGLTNLRIVQHDAFEVVRDMIPPDSVARVQVYFPDPWPKARHHKRRLIQPPFVEMLASRLAPGGLLHCATDWEPYAEQMLEVLRGCPLLENTASDPAGWVPRPDWRTETKFERRGLKLGHVVRDLVFARRTG